MSEALILSLFIKKKKRILLEDLHVAGFCGSCLASVSTGQQHYFASVQTQGKYLLPCEAFECPSDMHFFFFFFQIL